MRTTIKLLCIAVAIVVDARRQDTVIIEDVDGNWLQFFEVK
jgi:hypothetical protein